MSYDLQIWTAEPVVLPDALQDTERWERNDDSQRFNGTRWSVVVWNSVRVCPEDIPRGVVSALPGIAYLTELNLSPYAAEEKSKRFLTRTARSIAKAAHGAIFDPQTEVVDLPSGIHRFVKSGPAEEASLVSMCWWFIEGPIIQESNFGLLLDVFKVELPEALPRRYGQFEPPQSAYMESARDEFLSFLQENVRKRLPIWYPTAPVADVFFRIPDPIGEWKMGFRSAHLAITVDGSALEQPGWRLTLKRFWHETSHALRPFYGDVRTLRGYRRSRGSFWVGKGTQRHPIPSWFWRGIPAGPAHALVLGKPYTDLWPGAVEAGTKDSELVFVDTDEWTHSADVFSKIAQPPDSLAQIPGHSPKERRYPQSWPFGALG